MTLGDPGIGVMLMMRGPGGLAGGRVIEGLVSHLDVVPTVCDLLGKPAPAAVEGRSLLPLVNGRVAPADFRDAIYAEQTYHGDACEPLRCIRTDRYKLLLRHLPVGPQIVGNSRSAKLLQRHGWHNRPLGHEELFDLYLDPTEACNRASDPAYAAVKRDLADRLKAQMRRTGDPFVTGSIPPVPAQSGA